MGDSAPSQIYYQVLAGAGSGAITKTSIAPLERVKILFQIQGMHTSMDAAAKPKYQGILGTMRTVLAEDGFTALYKGNGANVLRIIPNYAIKFSSNDQIRELVKKPGQEIKDLSFHQMMLAGSMAGLIQITLTYPLELVRTRLSLADGMLGGIRYKGIVHCATDTVKKEGFRALYKGIGPTFLTGTPYVGLQMTFFELFKRWLPHSDAAGMGMFWRLSAGALAGLTAQTITFPGDTIRRRMQTNGLGGAKLIYDNSWDCLRKTVRREGVTGLYKGLGANAVRCIPGAAIQFAAYDTLKGIFGLVK